MLFNNLLDKKEIKIKKVSYGYYKPRLRGRVFNSFIPNEFYYTYDYKNRLIKKKSCKNTTLCKIEHIKYTGNKIFTSNEGLKRNLESRKVWERNDSIEIELTINKLNKIEYKSVITYNRDSIKLKEEHFKRDTLIYREINKIENNRIVQSIKSRYFKKSDSKVMNKSMHIIYLIYNEDLNVQTIIHTYKNHNIKKGWKQKFVYDKKGLLVAIKNYQNKKLTHTKLYKYKM